MLGVVSLHLGLKHRSDYDSTDPAVGLLDPPPQLVFFLASASTCATLVSTAVIAKDNMGKHYIPSHGSRKNMWNHTPSLDAVASVK